MREVLSGSNAKSVRASLCALLRQSKERLVLFWVTCLVRRLSGAYSLVGEDPSVKDGPRDVATEAANKKQLLGDKDMVRARAERE